MWVKKLEVDFSGPHYAFSVPDRDAGIHRRCTVRAPDDRSTRIPNELPPLPPGSRRPVMAMMDALLLKRVEESLSTFLGQHALANEVLTKTEELLSQAPGPLLCTRGRTCNDTIHDLRLRVLEPLLKFLLHRLDTKEHPDVSLRKRGGPYPRLQFERTDPSQPDGITLALITYPPTKCLALVVIHFEEDVDFLSFGPQLNLFARKGECKYHLHHEGPIPLNYGGRSHGAQAMLNKLALLMESAVERYPTTGEVIVPVRFGMILSAQLGVFAEAVVNPQNPDEVGLIYSPLFQTSDAVHRLHMEVPFRFARGSVALMFLASMIDPLSRVPEPPSEVVRRLFGQADATDTTDAEKWWTGREPTRRKLKKRWTPPSSVEIFSEGHYRVEARLSPTAWPPRISISDGEVPESRSGFEAVILEVVETSPARDDDSSRLVMPNPNQRLSTLPPALLSFLIAVDPELHSDGVEEGLLSDLVDVELESLPHLVTPQFIAEGGFAIVSAGILIGGLSTPDSSIDDFLSRSTDQREMSECLDADTEAHVARVDRPGSSPWVPRTSIPTDQAVACKFFFEVSKGVHEALFYEHVFPLLPSEAQALLPPYYGTYRSSEGSEMAVILGYGGRPIDEKDVDEALKKKVADAFALFDKCGVEHMDRELRNVLIRDDGSLCIIDWNLARLNFDRRFLKYGKEFRW